MSQQLKLLDEIHLLWLEEYKIQQEFLIYETTNEVFFKSGESSKLTSHKIVFERMLSDLDLMSNDKDALQLFDPGFIQNIKAELDNYQYIFKKVVSELKGRGYKDFGIEGEMREYAHGLMSIREIDQVNILMLRRHEKDFIIRKEDQYVERFQSLIEKVKKEINQNPSLSLFEKLKLDSIVNGYSSAFSKLVASEKLLMGDKQTVGEITQLARQHEAIVEQINTQKENAAIAEKRIQQNLFLVAAIAMIVVFALAFLFSFRLATQLSKPIVSLNSYINDYVDSKFSLIPNMDKRNSRDEITELTINFYKMADEITSYIKSFEAKVELRTNEIELQKNEILEQKLKINQQYNELIVKTDAIKIHQKLVVEKNKNIMASLRYAERIQKAIMPSKNSLNKILPQSFVFFQPRDIVSGDFYFIHEKGCKVFFAVADCTGHGVPGAFVSIIGIHAIHRALSEFNLEKPSDILNCVNDLVERNLSSYGDTVINDGMDIAFCCFDKEMNKLEYSGANIPLWIISKKRDENFLHESEINSLERINDLVGSATIREIRADKQPIGHYQKRTPFTNHTLNVEKEDMIYLFSDGYADQFGGPEGKKFKYEKLKSLLLNVQQYPIESQKVLIKDAITNWMGDFEQVDDICVMGIRV